MLDASVEDGVWYPACIALMREDRFEIEVHDDDGDKQSANTSFVAGSDRSAAVDCR